MKIITLEEKIKNVPKAFYNSYAHNKMLWHSVGHKKIYEKLRDLKKITAEW